MHTCDSWSPPIRVQEELVGLSTWPVKGLVARSDASPPGTVIFLSFWTDRSWQTVQTQIRLLLEKQSDQGLHCLQFLCILWMHYSEETPSCSTFRVITTNFLGVRIFRKFTVFIRSRVWSPSLPKFFRGDWSWNHFYGHSLPTAVSSRAVVSYWPKDVHQVLVNYLDLSLPRKSVVRLTDRLDMTIVVDWDVKPQNKQNAILRLRMGFVEKRFWDMSYLNEINTT